MGQTGIDWVGRMYTQLGDENETPKKRSQQINANEVISNEDVVAMDSLLAEAKVIAMTPRVEVALAA